MFSVLKRIVMHYDVFNGDADGIISLLQLRMAQPQISTLITGVKRDIKLLQQVALCSDVSGVTVLDISMEKNSDALYSLIDRDVPIFYCDHHRAGDVPQADNFTALIDLDAQVCTSLLINRHLKGRFVEWALVGAYGDNLFAVADTLADECGLSLAQKQFLKELGILINYNGYGAVIDDLNISPATLFTQLMTYSSPFLLENDFNSPYHFLKQAYDADLAYLKSLHPIEDTEIVSIYDLPCEAWARRISGVFGNILANEAPNKAHAVLTLNQNRQDYTVSVRAPLNHRTGADDICCQFPSGGGRKAAAGINQLPISDKNKFIKAFTSFYQEQLENTL